MFLEHIYNVNAIEPEGHNGKTLTCTHTASEKMGLYKQTLTMYIITLAILE